MALEFPYFLRRRLRLHEARRALLAGSPAVALERLADPCLAHSADAERLRARAREALGREAGGAPEAESGIASALEGLLEEMRAAREGGEQGVAPVGSPPGAGSCSDPAPAESPREPDSKPAVDGGLDGAQGEGAPLRFLLAVDDAGEFLVACGEQVVLGHARAGVADLPFLADLDARHARIRGGESFHGGPLWRVEPIAGQNITVDGAPIGAGGAELADGDEIGLSPNLDLRFTLPEVSSGVCCLELLHGAECFGAARVLLVRPRSAACLRISARRDRHIAVRGLPSEVRLELADGELVIHCEAGLWARGLEGAAEQREAAPVSLRIPCPPERRIDFVVGSSEGGRPPFGFSVSPVASSGEGDL